MITYTEQAELAAQHLRAVEQILSSMRGMNPSENRGVVRLLGAAGEDAEQALLLIQKIRGEL
jgi:hypothetical protein